MYVSEFRAETHTMSIFFETGRQLRINRPGGGGGGGNDQLLDSFTLPATAVDCSGLV